MLSAAFLVSSLVVIVSPGPDLALITRMVLRHRRIRPALAAAVGMITAGALQVALGALGLAVLLAARPGLFAAVRWVGAAVLLVWAGLIARTLLRPEPRDVAPAPPGDRRAFVQGLVCTGANPKVGIFLMAFLPQFVPPGVPPALGVAVLAAAYLALGLVTLVVWMTLVHRFGRLTHSTRSARVADALTALVFGAFAVRLIVG